MKKGFSQGAVLATLLIGQNKLKAKGVILMSGSDIMDDDLVTFGLIETPCLHFVGEKDDLYPLVYSQ
jgi:predicted esterase